MQCTHNHTTAVSSGMQRASKPLHLWILHEPHSPCRHVVTEMKKNSKYAALDRRFIFQPVAVETSGAMAKSLIHLLKGFGSSIGREISGSTREWIPVPECLWLKYWGEACKKAEISIMSNNITLLTVGCPPRWCIPQTQPSVSLGWLVQLQFCWWWTFRYIIL